MNTTDETILRSLAVCVRFLSTSQIARLRHCDPRAARRFAARLVRAGLAHRLRLLAQAIDLPGPIARWKPGQAVPSATEISRLASARYENRPMRKITAITATSRTLRHFAVERRPPLKRYQQTHDLGLSEVFVYFWQRWPLLAQRWWVGEDCFRRSRGPGEKVEDAQLRDPQSGRTLLVVEFTGKYTASRVAEFIEDVTARQLPFICF